jgi:hypothetical protein
MQTLIAWVIFALNAHACHRAESSAPFGGE